MDAKNMKTEELIGALVELDKQGKENRARHQSPTKQSFEQEASASWMTTNVKFV